MDCNEIGHWVGRLGCAVLVGWIHTGHVRAESPAPESASPVAESPAYLEAPSLGRRIYETALKNKLTVGLRRTSFSFEDTERPEDETRTETYLGYINELRPEKESSVGWVVGYEPCRYVALEYSQEEVSARTWNFNNHASDGVLKMSGPIYGATLRIPVQEWLSPYVGVGYAPWSAEFQTEDWWALGYASEADHIALGRPATPPVEGARRVIEVEDDDCRFLVFGVSVRLHRNVSVDVMMRKLELTSKAAFYRVVDDVPVLEQTGAFPMDHTSYGVSIHAIF